MLGRELPWVREVMQAKRLARLTTPHTLRHGFATHLLMIDTRMPDKGGRGVSSPLDAL